MDMEKRKAALEKKLRNSGDKIPEDIIFTNLLPKLSAKSVLRFKSVRKSWYSTIRSPKFLDLYLLNSYSRPEGTALLLSCHNPRLYQQFFFGASSIGDEDGENIGQSVDRLLELDTEIELNVSPSVNGLFCIYPSAYSNILINCSEGVSIFNPTTREVVSLPPLVNGSSMYYAGLNKNRVYYHFGYESVAKEYKVVGICGSVFVTKFDEGDAVECQIFTLGGGDSWKKVSSVIPVSFEPCTPAVCINGSIHWLIKDKRVLLAFDLVREVFRLMQLPSGICDDEKEFEFEDRYYFDDYDDEYNYDVDKGNCVWPCLVQVGDFLAVLKYNDLTHNSLYMWVLKDYQNEQWVMESVSYPKNWNLYNAVPYGSTHVGEIFLSLNHGAEPGVPTIVYCNLEQETYRSIELPEADEILEREDSSYLKVDLVGCYPENIMPLPR